MCNSLGVPRSGISFCCRCPLLLVILIQFVCFLRTRCFSAQKLNSLVPPRIVALFGVLFHLPLLRFFNGPMRHLLLKVTSFRHQTLKVVHYNTFCLLLCTSLTQWIYLFTWYRLFHLHCINLFNNWIQSTTTGCAELMHNLTVNSIWKSPISITNHRAIVNTITTFHRFIPLLVCAPIGSLQVYY